MRRALSGARLVGPYRYHLWRSLHPAPPTSRILFVMLNPSTADATADDPTLRRCVAFAKEWGFGRLDVCNLFAYRSPDPKVLRSVGDPIGPLNDGVIRDRAARAEVTVVAWGAGGALHDRGAHVARTLLARRALFCLGETRTGEPRHPLYVPRDVSLVRYR